MFFRHFRQVTDSFRSRLSQSLSGSFHNFHQRLQHLHEVRLRRVVFGNTLLYVYEIPCHLRPQPRLIPDWIPGDPVYHPIAVDQSRFHRLGSEFCLVCSAFANSAAFQVLWTFSIYLESVAILPQLFLVSKTGEAESITSHYLFALGSYRALYILNWVSLVLWNEILWLKES